MTPDLELDAWREQWQAQVAVPPDLRRRVERGSRNMRVMLALEVLVTVVIGGGSVLWAVLEPRTEMLVLAIATWLFLAAAWTFAAINRRGTWSPTAFSTAEFVEFSILRGTRKLSALRFGIVLYFVEMAFCLAWLYRDPARREALPAIIFCVATPVFLIGAARYRRRLRLELAGLVELQSPR